MWCLNALHLAARGCGLLSWLRLVRPPNSGSVSPVTSWRLGTRLLPNPQPPPRSRLASRSRDLRRGDIVPPGQGWVMYRHLPRMVSRRTRCTIAASSSESEKLWPLPGPDTELERDTLHTPSMTTRASKEGSRRFQNHENVLVGNLRVP